MKRSEMAECLAVIFVQWQHIEITEPLVNLWQLAFPNISQQDFLRACVVVLKVGNNGFPPTIDKVTETLVGMNLVPADQISEGEAWQLLMLAVRKFGQRQPEAAFEFLALRSKRVADVAQQLGWRDLCLWKTDDAPANRAHFWRMYNSLKERDNKADRMGLPRPEPMLQIENNVRKSLPENKFKLPGRAGDIALKVLPERLVK